MRRVLCTICMRGGSKGVPKKNLRVLYGKPLMAYTIEQALVSKMFEHVVVSTDSDEIAEKVHLIRDHGRDPKDGKVKLFGFNTRLDNLQAAILAVKLKYYDEDISRRREIASIYNENLKDVEEIFLPPPPASDSDHFDIFQNYEIEAHRRDDLRKFLSEKGVGTIIQWGGYTVHQFDELGLNAHLDYTDRMVERFMLLPMHQMLTDENVLYICNQIIKFYES